MKLEFLKGKRELMKGCIKKCSMTICVGVFIAILLGACVEEKSKHKTESSKNEALIEIDGDQSDQWLYILQDVNIDNIIDSGVEMVVMDYSRDGSAEEAFTKNELDELLESGITPIAYLSIGEAEDYRFYWKEQWAKKPPKWLGATNKDWAGNYKVRFWEDDWKSIIYKYIDEIIEAGFKGIYLDIIDAYEYWEDIDSYGFGKEEQRADDPYDDPAESATRMISFVIELADYCRIDKGVETFLIIPQNGEALLDYDQEGIYIDSISGIGIEDLWFDETDDNDIDIIEERLNYLRTFIAANKFVLSVDYIDDGSGYRGENKRRIEEFIAYCEQEDFHYYIGLSDRELDEINVEVFN